MKRVLMIAGVLVLSLGALTLWLSIEPRPEPPSGTPTGATEERTRQKPTPAHEARTTGDTGKTASQSTQLTQPNAPEPEKESGFRPITDIRSDSDRPQGDTATTLAHSSAPGSSRQDVLGGDSQKASATAGAGTQAAPPTPGKSPAIERPQKTTEPIAKSIKPQKTRVAPNSQLTQPSTTERSQLGAAQPTPGPAVAPRAPAPKRRSQPSGRSQRSPAPPGRYETITTATARAQPDAMGPIVDRIRRGTILNVTGSNGDWLIVYSKKKNITVYVRRDEAMLSRRPPTPSTDVPESQWPHVEQMIRQAFSKYNVAGVQATFIGDTAYLKGTVKSDRERERAEIFARSVLEVKHVFNGIRVE